MTTSADGRSYRCESCGGRVSLPAGTRRFDLDTIRNIHQDACPGVHRIRKEPRT